MQKRRFVQCDVFTATPTKGNGLAVVVDALGLSDAQMQDFAAWTNLAETTFILPPEDPLADYKLRIFTPVREMLFAGHPTLGSCATWLHCGGRSRQPGLVVQECGIGLVEIDHKGPVPAFVAPPTRIDALSPERVQAIVTALDLDPGLVVRAALLENGPVWQALELTSAEAVLAADSARVRWSEHKAIGLIGPHPQGSECRFEVRMLAPSSGMSEDPITGSLNAALAQWLYAQGRITENYTVAQGTAIKREGRVHIALDRSVEGRVLIGGQTHLVIEGQVTL